MTVFFTSDQHFGHDRIRELCHRPHASLTDMNTDMVAKWNAVVQDGDEVYHLGDFAFHDAEQFFHRLNGHKHLVIGNHDRQATLMLPWTSRPQIYHELKTVDGIKERVILFHYPIENWNHFHHGSVHLHGHTHGNLPDRPGRCDVGVDRWHMQPVTLAQIKTRLAGLPS